MNQQQPNPPQRQPRMRYQPGPSRSARRRRDRRRRTNAVASSGTLALQPSRITRRVVTNLTKRSPTISSAGLAWLRQYLNPMGPSSSSVAGFPDGSAVTTCIADYSNNFNISFPPREAVYCTGSNSDEKATLLDAATYAKIDAWTKADITLCILALPMLRNVVMVRLYPTTPTAFTLSDGIPNFVQRFPNWSAFTTEGKVLNNGDSPGYIQSFIYLPNVDKHLSAARGYRLLSRGLTGIYTAPSLETQGFVTACQYLAEGAIQTQTVGNNFVQSVEVNADKTVKNVGGKRLIILDLLSTSSLLKVIIVRPPLLLRRTTRLTSRVRLMGFTCHFSHLRVITRSPHQNHSPLQCIIDGTTVGAWIPYQLLSMLMGPPNTFTI